MIAEGLQGFMTIDKTNVDNEENQGLPEVYEFFTKYVRRIHPDTHWKRTMKINPNKGKELLSTNWRMDERKKKAKGRREGGEDDNDDGSGKDDGYHSDKCDDVEELPFRLDNDNLRNVTGLDSEMEEESEKGDEDDEEDDGGGEKGDDEDDEVGAENEKQPAERRSKINKDR